MSEDSLYLHGLKQRIAYHRQQSASQLEAAKALEKEKNKLQVVKDGLVAEKKRLEKDNNDLFIKRNSLSNQLRLKKKAYNILNMVMEKLKADYDRDMVATKASAKAPNEGILWLGC